MQNDKLAISACLHAFLNFSPLVNKLIKLEQSINGKIYGLNPRFRCYKVSFSTAFFSVLDLSPASMTFFVHSETYHTVLSTFLPRVCDNDLNMFLYRKFDSALATTGVAWTITCSKTRVKVLFCESSSYRLMSGSSVDHPLRLLLINIIVLLVLRVLRGR